VGLSRKSAEVPSLEAEVPSLATWLVNVRSPVAAQRAWPQLPVEI
jgi:hypothetical protein